MKSLKKSVLGLVAICSIGLSATSFAVTTSATGTTPGTAPATFFAPITSPAATISWAIADIEKVDVDGKLATINLYNSLVANTYGESGFYLKTSWLAHGDRAIFIPWGKATEVQGMRALAIEISKPVPGGVYAPTFRIKYTGPAGISYTSPLLLKEVLSAAYN